MKTLVFLFVLIVWSGPVQADPPIGWRGDGTGEFQKVQPPTQWSASSGQNIVWKTPMPSWANGSPVVHGNRVFVTSEPSTLIAVDATTGKVLWSQRHDFLDTLTGEALNEGRAQTHRIPALTEELGPRQKTVNRLKRDVRRQRSNPTVVQDLEKAMEALNETRTTLERIKSTYHVTETEKISHQYASGFVGYASATPLVSDGHVYALFGNGVLGCHTLDGTRVWMTHVDIPAPHMHGYHSGHAASPQILDGVLVVGIGHVHAFDALTGKKRWMSGEYRDFGTPATLRVGEAGYVITPMGRVLQIQDGKPAHQTSAALWYIGPLIQGDRLYFVGNAQGKSNASALRLTAASDGTLKSSPLWSVILPKERYYGTPAPHDGLLHVTTRYGEVLALDAETGAIRHRTAETLRKPIEVYSSPLFANGHLYMTSEDGTTYVYQSGESGYTRVATNGLEPLRSSLFVDRSSIYIRGLHHLYRIQHTNR